MTLSRKDFTQALWENVELKKSLRQCLDIIAANRAILADGTGYKEVAKAEKWARYLLNKND